MKKNIKIGDKEYKSKKDAISHYRIILNSYDYGQSLNDDDYDDLIDLLDYSYSFNNLEENTNDNIKEPLEIDVSKENHDKIENGDLIIEEIKVAKVQYNCKCFELFYNDDTSQYISYLMIINNKKYTPESLFNIACRNSIQDDLQYVKKGYFKNNSIKGQVKCQETNQLSKWEELAVDHRQPNTFSVIVDRFKEVYKIDINEIEYTSTENNLIIFKDELLALEFVKYHKEKANLRIVRKECNSSRTGMARIKRTTKDLSIK